MNSPHQQYVTKRPRENSFPPAHVQEMVSSIHQALTTKQRLSVLRHLQATLLDNNHGTDTGDPLTVNWFLEAGVVQALVLQLGYVLQRQGSEVEQLCSTLDLFLQHEQYPHSKQKHQHQQQQPPLIGLQETLTDLGPNFINLLAQVLQLQLQHGREVEVADVIPLRSALSILHTVSGTSSGTLSILKCQTVLHGIVDVLRYYRDQLITVDAALLEVLGCLKSLTYYGDDYRRQLLQVPGLVSALTSLPLTRTTSHIFFSR